MRVPIRVGMLLMSLLLIAVGATTSRAADQDRVSKPAVTVAGVWSENWGTPGKTDVTYHDRYQVTQTMDGAVKVQILNRNQRIFDERFDGTVLTFKQRTDAFIVHYSLTLQQDGMSMVGTAVTPKKGYKIVWERMQ